MSTLLSANDCRTPRILHTSSDMKACAVITLVLVANTAYNGVEAWGGLFNRFSPEMLSNLGYGGHGGYMNRPGLLQVYLILLLDAILGADSALRSRDPRRNDARETFGSFHAHTRTTIVKIQ